MGCNLTCVRDFWEIFATMGKFSGMEYRMLPIAFSATDLRCYGNEI